MGRGVGPTVGKRDGGSVGKKVGGGVGDEVGFIVGPELGTALGLALGPLVGEDVNAAAPGLETGRLTPELPPEETGGLVCLSVG